MAGVPWTGDVPWSDAAEMLVREHEPVLASFLKAEWYDRAARPDESRRELARHANDPRALEELMGHFASGRSGKGGGAGARSAASERRYPAPSGSGTRGPINGSEACS